jgi:uncharacterized ubiquitin-like protein YukD
MNSIKKITSALILIFSTCLVYSQTYKPVLKVTKGQEYNYLMEMTMDMTQSMGGQEMKYGTSASTTIKNLIANVKEDGKVEVIASNWDAKVTTKIMKDTTMTFKGKVGPSTKVTFDKFGNVLSKVKLDTVQMDSKLAGIDNDMANIVFCEFPETPIKVGDKWTKEHTDSVPAGPMGKMEIKTKSEYSLGAKEMVDGKSYYKVTVTSNLLISGKGNMQGMDLALNGTGVKNDELYVDPATGVVYSDKATMEMNMNIAVSGQQNMTIPMTQKINTSYKLID